MVTIVDKNVKGDKNLILQANTKYLSDFYRSKNLEILLTIKFLAQKQKGEEPIDKINSAEISNLMNINFKKLLKLSEIFKDDYTQSLLENTKLVEMNIPTKFEIMSEFNKIKVPVFESFFINKNPTLLQIFFSTLMSKFTDCWLEVYNPFYNEINDNDPIVVKKFKALSFVKYYINNSKYSEAYHYLQYLNSNNSFSKSKINEQTNFEKFTKLIEIMTKHDVVIDLLESHFK
jgi:hypothetical protein